MNTMRFRYTVDAMHCVSPCKDAKHCVSTCGNAVRYEFAQNGLSPQSKNLSSIVRGIKIGTTVYARRNNLPFAWQARFHDRIIRDQEEMNRIAEYIENNVARWEYDGMNRGALRRKYASILSGKNKYILYLSQAMGKEVQCPLSVSIKE